MKTRPIIFSSPMINALREGRKTQTRRIYKGGASDDCVKIIRRGELYNEKCSFPEHFQQMYLDEFGNYQRKGWIDGKCPYGKVGDLLSVRETFWQWGKWVKNGLTKTGKQAWKFYAYDHLHPVIFHPQEKIERQQLGYHKRPSIFLEKWASRLTLEITGARVERLQGISEEDAIKEGVEYWLSSLPRDFKKLRGILSDRYNSIQYRYLWESINGKGSWEANPWVWVLDFIVHNKNIDEIK